MTKPFKPMLAASMDEDAGESIDTLQYPVLATPKVDGIRTLIINGVAMSRALKPIPNAFIQSVIGKPEFNGLDGELLVGDTFQAATSGIMSEDGEPDFKFYVFDDIRHHDAGYQIRIAGLRGLCRLEPRMVALHPVAVENRDQLDAYSKEQLALGYEGVMVRKPDGPYKYGRATFKEGYLTKIKPLADAEATVVGFEERMHNANEAKTNALGRTERSSHKGNLVPMGTLGALICSNQALWPGVTFNIGTGFDDETRAALWRVRDFPAPHGLIGTTVKFKYQKIGTKDRPRIPVFLGFRDQRDIS